MNEFTKNELYALYSLAVRESQLPKEEVSQDEEFYKQFKDYWNKVSDKLQILHEQV
jgi:hypothetical protein